MFMLSLGYLVCLAVLVVLWVDVPNLSSREPRQISVDNNPAPASESMVVSAEAVLVDEFLLSTHHRLAAWVLPVMFFIWPIVMLESAFHWVTRPWNRELSRYHWFGLLFCLCPALRLCARSPEMHFRLWLPGLGWRRADRRLRRRLERQFSLPMIMIALLILPVLIIEFFMKSHVAENLWLRVLLHFGTGVIWFAFAAEFILMVSVAEKKLEYCKKHWVDLAIILLPVVSFLRSLRIFRSTRLVKLMRIQRLSQIARVYRLRGTTVKMLRALIVLGIFHRVFRTSPERSINKLKWQLQEVEAQAKYLRRRIARLERQKAAQDQIATEGALAPTATSNTTERSALRKVSAASVATDTLE